MSRNSERGVPDALKMGVWDIHWIREVEKDLKQEILITCLVKLFYERDKVYLKWQNLCVLSLCITLVLNNTYVIWDKT